MSLVDRRDLIEKSEVLQELVEKEKTTDKPLGTKKIGEKTGLHYMHDGNVRVVGGYFPNGVRKGGIKEALIRWRWIDCDIDEIRREMRELENRFNDPAITRYIERMEKRTGEGKTGIEDLLIEREKLEGQFMDELMYLLKVRGEIDKFVKLLDEFDREVITLRFLKGLEWETVGEKVGRNHRKLCDRIHRVLEHYDDTGEYLQTVKYRRHRKVK